MQVAKPVAFEVEIPKTTTEVPEVKKRLEADAKAAQGPSITLAQIEYKLKKAEEKRRVTLTNPSTRIDKKRVYKVSERKRSLDEWKEQQLKGKSISNLTEAEKKRNLALELKQKKVQKHLEKVEKVRKLKTLQEQEDLEKQKEELIQKLENATLNREQNLEKKKTIAHLSAEKKSSTNVTTDVPQCQCDF